MVGQDARVDLTLRLGLVSEEVKVTGDAPLVSVTTQDISGLVGERQVKDLPLNGRSYDLLLTLNPGDRQFHLGKNRRNRRLQFDDRKQLCGFRKPAAAKPVPAEWGRIYGRGRKQHATGRHQPAVAGRGCGARIQRAARFLWRRIRQTARRPGDHRHPVGQQSVARLGIRIPAQQRSGRAQLLRSGFGAAVSAQPVWRVRRRADPKDKTFFFGNYEGLRQHLHQTSAAFVPDAASRAAAVPSVQPLLNLWPVAPLPARRTSIGIAQVFSSPLQTIREDFGTARRGPHFLAKDSLSAIYTIDDGGDITATMLDPYSTDIVSLREQVFSLEETHSFSPSTLNVARVGLFACGLFFHRRTHSRHTGGRAFPGFCSDTRWVQWSSAAAPRPIRRPRSVWREATMEAICGSRAILFTFEDRLTLTRGRHQLSFGVWFQPFQSNETIALSQYGQATFTSLQTFLQGTTSSFLYDPAPTEMNWRSLLGAWYVEDVIRVTPEADAVAGLPRRIHDRLE